MLSIPKILGVMSCGFILCLSLSAQAAERMSPDPCAAAPDLTKCDEEQRMGIETIKGELVRVDREAPEGRETYFVKKNDGTEATMHVDSTTQMSGVILPGAPIEAKTQKLVGNDEKYALYIKIAQQ